MTFPPSPLNRAVTAGSARLSYTEEQIMSSTVRTVVRLRDALDVAATSALRERLTGLLRPGMRLLVLDLSRVPSCDSAGLAVLVGAQRRARLLGIVLRLAAPSPPVAGLLRRTGLDRSLTICADLSSALAEERHESATVVPATQVLTG